jgi:hypothetical protein
MARGRLISRTLGTSRKFAALHGKIPKLAEFAQSLYPLLVACSDDFGRQSGDAFTVKCAVFPSSPRSEADFGTALEAMHASGLITLYQSESTQVLEIVRFDEHQPGLSKRTSSKFPETPVNFPEIPSEEKRREEKLLEEKGREESSELALVPLPVSAEQMAALWNETVSRPIVACQLVTIKRRNHINARLKERPIEEWRVVFTRIQASAFCCGQNDRGWVASFDWVVGSADVAVKVLEGKYDNRDGHQVNNRTAGNAAAIARFIARGKV